MKRSPGIPSTALTERERQIMHLVCEKQSNEEVGRKLNLPESTVKAHLHHIYQKLAIRNRTALAAGDAAVQGRRAMAHRLGKAARGEHIGKQLDKVGGKVMNWFNGKTSIAGIQIPNWLIILGAAVIVILLITSVR